MALRLGRPDLEGTLAKAKAQTRKMATIMGATDFMDLVHAYLTAFEAKGDQAASPTSYLAFVREHYPDCLRPQDYAAFEAQQAARQTQPAALEPLAVLWQQLGLWPEHAEASPRQPAEGNA